MDTPNEHGYTAHSASAVPISPPVQGQGNTTGRAVAEAIFRHQRILLWTFAIVFSLTGLYVLFIPRTYQSEMNILVRNARPDYLISPEKSVGNSQPTDVTEEKVNSEMEVLRSKDVADIVVDANWLSVPSSRHSSAEIKAHEASIRFYTKHLTIESLRKSNVIHVTFTARSAAQAHETLDHLLQAFLAKQREIEHSASASTFFASEAERYKTELDQAQQQLAGYQQQNQMVSLPEKEATLQTEINTLEDQIRATQVAISEASNRIASGQSQLTTMPKRMATSRRLIPNTYTVEQLSTLLANLQNQRTALLVKFLPTDRLVQELDKQIADTSATLKSATEARALEETTDINPVFEQVRGAVAQSHTELSGLTGRLEDQNAQLVFLKQALAGVEGSTVDYSTLQSRVTELQTNYQLYTQKRNEAEIADAMDRENLVNVAVAERPTFSIKPYRPDPAIDLSLGAFTALFLAVCLVFFAEMWRDTVASPWELETLTRFPVLATVPRTENLSSNSFWGETGPRNPGPSRGSPDHDSSGGWISGDYAPQSPSGYMPPQPTYAYETQNSASPAFKAEPPVFNTAHSPASRTPAHDEPEPTRDAVSAPASAAAPAARIVPPLFQDSGASPRPASAPSGPGKRLKADEELDQRVAAAAEWFAKVKIESSSRSAFEPALPLEVLGEQPVADLGPAEPRLPQPVAPISPAPAPPRTAPALSHPANMPVVQPLPARFAASASPQAPQLPAVKAESPETSPADLSLNSVLTPPPPTPAQELPMFNFRKSAPTLLNLAELTADDAEETFESVPFDTRTRASDVQPAATARAMEPQPEPAIEPRAERRSERLVLDELAPVRDPIPRYVPPPHPLQNRATPAAFSTIPDAFERTGERRRTPRQPMGTELEGSRGEPRAYPRAPRRPDSQVFAAEQAAGTLPRDASAIVSKPRFYAEDRTPQEPAPVEKPTELSASESQLIAIAQSEPVHRPSSARLAAIRDEIQGKRLSPSQRMRTHARGGFVAYSVEKEK